MTNLKVLLTNPCAGWRFEIKHYRCFVFAEKGAAAPCSDTGWLRAEEKSPGKPGGTLEVLTALFASLTPPCYCLSLLARKLRAGEDFPVVPIKEESAITTVATLNPREHTPPLDGLCFISETDRVPRTYTPIYKGGGFRIGTYNIDSLRTLLSKPHLRE